MKNELQLYVDESKNEGVDTREMRCLASLQGIKSTDAELDKPADKSLGEAVSAVVAVEKPSRRVHCRGNSCDWTVSEFLLLLIALLLFLNFVVR